MQFASARFPAAIERSRVVGDFVMTETRYGGGAVLPTHWHEQACIVVVLQGTFGERYGSRDRTGEPGMLVLRPEGEPHSDSFGGDGGRCLNVELSSEWLTRVRAWSPALMKSDSFSGNAFPLLGRRLREELAHPDDASPLAVESLVLSILANGVRASSRSVAQPPPWLVRARELIHEERTTRITLSRIAAAVGVHPVHLAASFRRFFGQTMAAYVRQLRIEHACRALAGSDLPLADVALLAGFSDQSHLCRLFKRAMRTTPAGYRAANRAH